MTMLMIGCLLLLFGTLLISFPELCLSLKKHDEVLWHKLGDPYGDMFTSKTIAVYSWVLNHGYTLVDSDEVFDLGEQAYKQAVAAKYVLIGGVVLVVLGFLLGNL